jgi:predicted enzyme related to lactoylglutathione lyase
MAPRFVNPLPFVADSRAALAFYRDVVGLAVVEDKGDFVRFEDGFALHDGASLLRQAFGTEPDGTPFGRANLVLYFETDDLEAAHARIAAQAAMIHPIRRMSWGGRVFRFRDPDGHIVEMGEP